MFGMVSEVRHVDLAWRARPRCAARSLSRRRSRRLQREPEERQLETERLAVLGVEMAGDVPPLVPECRDGGRGRAGNMKARGLSASSKPGRHGVGTEALKGDRLRRASLCCSSPAGAATARQGLSWTVRARFAGSRVRPSVRTPLALALPVHTPRPAPPLSSYGSAPSSSLFPDITGPTTPAPSATPYRGPPPAPPPSPRQTHSRTAPP